MDATPDPPPDAAPSPDLDRWRRWVDHGGAWDLLDDADGRVTLRLLTCDGGEEMERLVSDDPALAAAVRGTGAGQGDEPSAP